MQICTAKVPKASALFTRTSRPNVSARMCENFNFLLTPNANQKKNPIEGRVNKFAASEEIKAN